MGKIVKSLPNSKVPVTHIYRGKPLSENYKFSKIKSKKMGKFTQG
jgi:hypothetical protein